MDALAEACGDGGLSGGLGRCGGVMDQTRGGCDRGDFRADRLIVSFLPSISEDAAARTEHAYSVDKLWGGRYRYAGT